MISNTYPALTLLVPLCAAGAGEEFLSEAYAMRDTMITVGTSAEQSLPTISWSDSAQAIPLYDFVMPEIKREIEALIASLESFEEKMAVLDEYISANQEEIRKCLKTITTDLG